ncbi:MAG TPA: AsmA-like C-terminal region-containing protein, partial [Myxococcales bacterium]|nr:AsmA-like C-terminal region-containing protein [Myxococcales bacterium]
DGRLEPGALRIRNLRATVAVRGTTEMPLKASFDLEGVDIAPLARMLLGPSPALSGPISGKLQLSGTPARLSGAGALDLSRVTLSDERAHCPPPARRQLVVDEVRLPVLLKPTAFESAPAQGKISKGTVALNLTAGLSGSPDFTLTDIKISGVQLQPILQDFLCQGFAVSGPLDLTGRLSLRAADPLRTMSGTGQLKIGAGRVVGEGALGLVRGVLEAGNIFDAALRGKLAAPVQRQLEFDSITGSYRVSAGVVSTDDLLYQGKDLRVSAAGTYALTDGRTDMKVVATQGRNQLRAQITGSGSALRVVPTGVNVKEPAEVKKFLDQLLR